jgi:hypothetical protein
MASQISEAPRRSKQRVVAERFLEQVRLEARLTPSGDQRRQIPR